MKVGITADCSSGLEYAPFEHNVKITRTIIHFDGEELVDGVDITAKEFYKRLESTDQIPSTSAPTPGEIIKRVEEWKEEGCTDVIHFPISFGLSSYGENLEKVGEDYVEGVNIHVFNAHSACLMQGYCAHYAEILAQKGYSIEEIFSECQKLADQTCAYFIVNDLKYLVKNGRLNVMSGFIGALAQIKPLLCLGKTGTIDVYEKVRTHKRALERALDIVFEQTKESQEVIYLVIQSNQEELAANVKKLLAEKVGNRAKRIEITTVTPTVGAHIGSGILGIGYLICDGLKEKL